jgi:hypothetical protein
MAELVIRSPLAERLRALAEREKRPVDAVLNDMLGCYHSALSDDEVDTWLATSGITLPARDEDILPPISPEEERALADEIGQGGPLSTLIIQERNEGP